MKDIRRMLVVMFLVGPLVGLYTTFVLENLWNWFATDALHLPAVSFWVMYGLVLIIGMFSSSGSDFEQEHRFKVLATVLDACVPEEKRELVTEQLDEHQSSMWADVGFKIFGRVLGITWTLVVGWGVHTFFL
jgi:hypothetical protein